MSLDKAIAHRKERRKPYRGSASFDRSCRHQGSCPHCERNRRIAELRERSQLRAQRKEDDQ